MDYMQIALLVATIVFGFLATYLQTKTKFMSKVVEYIAEAEDVFKDSTEAGGQKFEYVISLLMSIIPKPLQLILTRKVVSEIVQNTFDAIEGYAKTQLDKIIK